MAMRLVLLLVVVVSAAVGLGLALVGAEERAGQTAARPSGGQPVAQIPDAESLPAAERLDSRLQVKPETKKAVGEFALRGGRTLRLHTAATRDGLWCLIDVEEPSGGASSSCHPGTPFSGSKAIWVINMDGGPRRFADLYLLGVAAPAITVVALTKTDGTTVDAEPNADGVFFFESSPTELERDALPSALRLYGRNGKLVETITIPAPR